MLQKNDIEARFHVEQAKYFLNKKEYNTALNIFSRIHSETNNMLENIIECCKGLGDYRKGINVLKDSLRKKPEKNLWVKLSDCYFYNKDFELCSQAVDECLSYELSGELINTKLKCLFNLKKYDEIINLHDFMSGKITEDNLSNSSIYIFGKTFFEKTKKNYEIFDCTDTGKYLADAEYFFNKLFSRKFYHENILYDYIDILILKGDYNKANQVCNKSYLVTNDAILNQYNSKIKKLIGVENAE